MSTPHNAHVIKWMRWQHWLAKQERRYFAMFIWADHHNREAAHHRGTN